MPSARYKARSSPQLPMAKPSGDRKFSRMKMHAEKMRFERTGLVPDASEEYTNLKNWYKDMMEGHKEVKMKQNDLDMNIAKAQNREVARVFGGKTIGDGNLGILGCNTIWARGWSATIDHPQAPWPSSRELREEGDERHTSNYGRFLPIPRVPGNKTVVYKQKAWAPVEPFDAVMPVPKLYGMVNVNMFGFFDTEVDHNGVPYDDHDLPGEEYIVKRNENIISKYSKAAATNKQIISDNGSRSSVMATQPAFDFRSLLQQIYGQESSSTGIQATAASFVPRNIPALNPGRNHQADLETAGEVPDDTEAFKRDFFGPVYDALKETPSGRRKLRPDALGFTDPWKTQRSGKESRRANVGTKDVAGNGSPMKSSRRINAMESASPGDAFRQLNSIPAAVVLGDNEKIPRGLESPIKFRETPAFSSGKARANIPAPLKLKPRRYADVVKVIDNDSDDQEDGEVKLW